VLALFKDTYGPDVAAVWVQRWRMFWMACAELFGYANGNEWLVAQATSGWSLTTFSNHKGHKSLATDKRWR